MLTDYAGAKTNYSMYFDFEPLRNSSVAFKPLAYDDYHVFFISQYRTDGLVSREYAVYDFANRDVPVPVERHQELPSYVRDIESKYWITAVIETDIDIGIIFVEYEGVGYHCHFTPYLNSSVNIFH